MAAPSTTAPRPRPSARSARVAAAARARRWAPTLAEPGVAGVLVGALLAGAYLRYEVMRGPLGYVDYDEATVALQAGTFLAHPAVFFPNQSYGGTLEIFLTSLFFQVSSSALALKLVPIVLLGAAAIVTWRAATRLVPSGLGQLVVLVLMWTGPAFGIWESTKGRGFYGATILLAALAALLVARFTEAATIRRAAAFGFAAGVAVWTTPLLVLVYVPCAVWLAARCWRCWRALAWAVPAALVGASPLLLWNEANGWGTFSGPAQTSATSGELLVDGLGKVPTLVGLATPWDPDRALVPGAAVVTAVVLILLIAITTMRTRRVAPGFVATVLGGYVALYGFVVPLGAMGEDLRYLYPAMPFIALAIGGVIPEARRRWGAAALLGTVTMAAAMTSWWGIQGLEAAAPTDTAFLASPGIPEVADFLQERGITTATTDVAGTQLTFETDGAIRAASFGAPRFRDLQAVMFERRPTTYVLERDGSGNTALLEREVRRRGIGFEKRTFGVWNVYLLDRWLPPWEVGLGVFGGPLTEARAREIFDD